MTRATLRTQLLRQRADIPATQRGEFDQLICHRLQQIVLPGDALNIGVYSPIRGEPDLSACYVHWRACGHRLALPIVDEDTKQLHFHRWDADTPLRKAAFGVLVPDGTEPLAPDVLVIPCVGFRVLDGKPYRLGYGGGFFDRTLAARPCFAIGVAYDNASASSWTPDSWDIPLSMLVTPSFDIVAIASPRLKR